MPDIPEHAPKTALSPRGDLGPHLIYGSLGPPESTSQTGSAMFALCTALLFLLVWPTRVVPDKGTTRVCVCVRVCVQQLVDAVAAAAVIKRMR